MNEAERDEKNYADRGGYYPPRLKADMDNILRAWMKLIDGLLPMQPHFQSNIPSSNLVSNQICRQINGILPTSSKFGQHWLVMKNCWGNGANQKWAKYFK